MRSAAGDPMRSAAGDPDLERLFHPQLTDEDGNPSMVQEAGHDSVQIRTTFAVTLACVFCEFSTSASADDIYEKYKEWPVVHARKKRQKRGAYGSADPWRGRWSGQSHACDARRWPQQTQSWWGSRSGWEESWGGSSEAWAPGELPDRSMSRASSGSSAESAFRRRAAPSSTSSSDSVN